MYRFSATYRKRESIINALEHEVHNGYETLVTMNGMGKTVVRRKGYFSLNLRNGRWV